MRAKGASWDGTSLDLNSIFNNQDLCDNPTKYPTPTNATRVKFQSKDPTRVPRVKPHSNYTTTLTIQPYPQSFQAYSISQ